ncbi:restriction endonuclease subunit S [Streptomyces sp. Je 1-4]|uniref:restriction endonuclease subunit S n=1 Tax=Streptomyces TaxID=1883 RepID=UPI0021D9336B|nr:MULTISPECIES: restriction endonuclease subunit S [unclassified Streptomyces]UYB40150.1 restriction endonuclease subunit S [Streptomyces sp. Je 1-4]UZQ36241.1 restriction endonuclease subunit S [Streptomyces sp. Je 1-4] [Streptomyces sp. Je 1-4 4N24]UZQ43659.1 restriction endonuclease subunit S [Streptomyces sp. Je 1-4] [Streptomyces sp. Je 1-4 4N24_ara]
MTRIYRLGELSEITPSPSSDQFEGLDEGLGGTPVISPGDIIDGEIAEQSLLRSMKAVPGSLVRFRVEPGDLIMVRQGAVGRIALVEERSRGWLYHFACMRIRPDRTRVEPGYLIAYLSHPKVLDQLIARANVGTVTTVTARMVEELPVALPLLAEQRLLAGAVAEVDAQMNNHRQALARLGALRPALITHLLGGEVPGERLPIPAVAPGAARRGARGPRPRRLS